MSDIQTEQAPVIESPVETAPALEDPVSPFPTHEQPQPDINATIRDTIRESFQQQVQPTVEAEDSTYSDPVGFDKEQIKKELIAELQAEQAQQHQYQQTIQAAAKESTDEYHGYLGRMDTSLKNFGVDLSATENAFLNKYVSTAMEKEFFKKQNEVGRPILTRAEMQQVTASHWEQVKEVLGGQGVNTQVKINSSNLSPAAQSINTIQPARQPGVVDLVNDSLSRIKAGENLSSAELYRAYNEHRRRGRAQQ